jgi:NAD(P)-dependent dehydrogenase (short-subunit alcohol dehydrogenase family)
MKCMGHLEGRIIAVSGASRGIGYHGALEMVRQGAHVIAIARTVGGLEELDDAAKNMQGGLTLVPMDITDFAAIDRLGGQIFQRWGKLDGFFANAGILGGLSPLGHVEPKTFDKVMAINVTANWRFIRSFDALFKSADNARILLMTSGIVRSCKAFWGPYAMSKAAIEALGRTYAAECVNSNIRINLYNPGPVRTAMRAQAVPGEDPDSLPHPSELALSIAALMGEEVSKNGLVFDYPTESFYQPE